MSIRDAIFAILDTQHEEPLVGRTLFQKKLYVLAAVAGEDFGFFPHFYGPYSSEVADHIGALCAAGFVSESSEPTGRIAGPFGETVRYVYSLTEAGRDIVASREADFGRYRTMCGMMNGHELADNTILMPIAAKVHYIVSENSNASEADIRTRAMSLGWNINEADITRVVSYLQHLNLIEVE